MNDKILLQIDTFIQGQDTVDLTRECIKRAKLFGFPILLTAHSNIPEELQQMVDFVEIDLCNPILPDNGALSFLYTISDQEEIKIFLRDSDPHAPACLTSIINGSKFCRNNGFEFFLRIEFDSIFFTESIIHLKNLVTAATNTNGLIFTNFGEWVEGKFMFFKSEIYSDCFNYPITSSDDYLKFMEEREVPNKNWRHLQAAQYHILGKCGILNNMIIAPISFLEKSLDRSYNKIRDREFGIFTPGSVENIDGNNYATVAWGFAKTMVFEFEIYHNNILVEVVEQSFVEGKATYKIFPIFSGTIHKIVYKNPISKKTEQWEFTSSEELKHLASIVYK